MNVELISAWTSVITAIAATAFVAIGGVWSYYTFRVLKLREKAEAELKKAQSEAEGKAVVDVDLGVQILEGDSRYDCPVKITVRVKNSGTRDTVLAFDHRPLVVSEILLQGGIEPQTVVVAEFAYIDGPQDEEEEIRDMLNLRAGSTDSFEFMIGVIRPGLYRARFDAKLSSSEHDYTATSGMKIAEEGLAWSAESYFNVPPAKVTPWTGMEIPGTRGRAVGLITEEAVKFSNLLEEYADSADVDELQTDLDEIINLREVVLNLRAALVVNDVRTAQTVMEHNEDWLRDFLDSDNLDEIRTYIETAIQD